VFIAQIESLQGVNAAGPIAATDGVDVLFVGPSDLARSLAASNYPQAPTYQECLSKIVTAANSDQNGRSLIFGPMRIIDRKFLDAS